MKKNHWNLILNLSQKAPKSGLYIFAIRDDNHIEYDYRHLQEGDALYSGEEKDPTAWFVPIAYHFCNEYKNEFELLELRNIVTENSWRPCDYDVPTPGLRLICYLMNEEIHYELGYEWCRICIATDGTTSFNTIYNELEIYGRYNGNDYYQDDLINIQLLAYHYVELFDEEGHAYWWRTYNQLHNKE